MRPTETVLLQAPGLPLLLAGDEAFLFLSAAPAAEFGSNAYWPAWPHTSIYVVRAGQIEAAETNSFGADMERLGVTDFEDLIRQIADRR